RRRHIGWDRGVTPSEDRKAPSMPTRTATTTWTGDLQSGSGSVEMTGSKVGTYEVSFPKRAADEAGGTTSPEELIAAAHSSCFAMAFSNELAQAGARNAKDRKSGV